MPRAAAPGRIGWIDAARGIGILLVVLGHTLGGLIDSLAGADAPALRWLFLGIYTFHMPLFFLLAGLLVAQRLEKGTGRFLRGLLPTIVWPYLLWSVVQLGVIFAIGSLANRPIESIWPGLLGLGWKPVSQFWFLYALAWMHLGAALLLPRIGREGLLLLGLALKAVMLIMVLPLAARLVCAQAFFYALGVWLGASGLEGMVGRYRRATRMTILPAIALGLIIVTMFAARDYAPDINVMTEGSPRLANVAWRFPAMAAALAGTMAVIGLAMAIGWAPLAALGRRTMPVFLLHVMFVSGGRILLVKLGLGAHLWLLVAILFALGIAGPLVVDRIAARLGLRRWLGFA
jgi:fucose 4-O-acetylase-like acetyltransferase